MKFLTLLYIRWKFRNLHHRELVEIYGLTMLAARRCAYDLGHAADFVRDREFSKRYSERSRMWLGIFEPTGGKNYRHEMHREISNLASRVRELERLCEENNIDHGGMPF